MTQGVYILIKDCDILYVGASINIERRLYEHKNKDYDHYVIIKFGKRYLALEMRMIAFLKPILNKSCAFHDFRGSIYHYDTFRGIKNGHISKYVTH